jgi:hypothetical protein
LLWKSSDETIDENYITSAFALRCYALHCVNCDSNRNRLAKSPDMCIGMGMWENVQIIHMAISGDVHTLHHPSKRKVLKINYDEDLIPNKYPRTFEKER